MNKGYRTLVLKLTSLILIIKIRKIKFKNENNFQFKAPLNLIITNHY